MRVVYVCLIFLLLLQSISSASSPSPCDYGRASDDWPRVERIILKQQHYLPNPSHDTVTQLIGEI